MNKRQKVWWFPNNAQEPIEVETLDGLLVGEVPGYLSGTEVNYGYATKEEALYRSMLFHRASHILFREKLERAQAKLRRHEHNEALRGMEECDRMHAGLWK